MSGATGFRRPRKLSSSPMGILQSTKPCVPDALSKIMSVDSLLEEPHSPSPSLNQTQEIFDQDDDFDDDDDDEDDEDLDDLELNQILEGQAKEWLNEFGEKIFKLTVHQWLVKRERQQKKILPKKPVESAVTMPPKKRQRS